MDLVVPKTIDSGTASSTPQALVKAGKRQWQKFMHAHRIYRPETAEKRLEIFARADKFASPSAAVTAAKSLLAVTLAKQAPPGVDGHPTEA